MKPIHRPGKMNATEAKYALHLEGLKAQGVIVRYEFERIKFILADRTTYTPDFYVLFPGHIEFHQIGRVVGDFVVTANRFPEFRWKNIKYHNRKWEVIREI